MASITLGDTYNDRVDSSSSILVGETPLNTGTTGLRSASTFSMDHGTLNGLTDNDHNQYALLDASNTPFTGNVGIGISDFTNGDDLRIHGTYGRVRITNASTGTGMKGIDLSLNGTKGALNLYEDDDLEIYTKNVKRATFHSTGGLDVVGGITGNTLTSDTSLTLGTGPAIDTIETSVTNDDTHLPTSGAVVDYCSDYITELSEDATPQLGGNLDLQTYNIEGADADDLTKLSELTATSTELNYVGGVTSLIQDQLDAKAPIADPTFTGEIGIGATNVSETELSTLEGLTATTAELNIMDGSATIQATVTLDGTDGVVISDGDTMKQCLVSDIPVYTASASQTLTNKTIDADGTGNSITNIENADIKANAAIDATKIADGTVTSTEFQYINSLTSNVQTQLDAKAPLNSSISAKSSNYTLDAFDNGTIIECTGSITITLPDSMSTGYQVTIVNMGTGTITLAASTTLYTQDSNTKLENQYGAASAYHRGSDIWVAFGDLST